MSILGDLRSPEVEAAVMVKVRCDETNNSPEDIRNRVVNVEIDMSESKICAYVVIGASARFSIDKPDGWDDMTDEQKKEYFAEHMETSASLCHQCSDHIETDCEVDMKWLYNNLAVEDMWEENR